MEDGTSQRVRKILAGVPASVVIRDQILALSFSRSKRQYWTVGNRPIRKNDLRSLHRNSAEAQIQDRSRQKTGLNTVPGFSRVYNKPPLRAAKGTRAQHAGDARNSPPPSFPRAIRHSRGRGNPEKTKHSAKPPLRKAKGTRAQHAGDARKPPTPPLRSSEHQDNPSIIPPPPPSSPQAIRHSRGLPRHSRTPSVIPADAGTQKKQSTPPNLPFAERRGRVRSTQGMPENHQHRPFEAPNTKTTPPSSPHPLRHSRKPLRHSRKPLRHSRKPLRHSREPSVIPADAGTQRKTKHAISTQTHTPTINATTVTHPSPSQGETKRGSLVRAQGGAGHPSFPQAPPSFPRTREPREKQSTPIPPSPLIPLIVREFH